MMRVLPVGSLKGASLAFWPTATMEVLEKPSSPLALWVLMMLATAPPVMLVVGISLEVQRSARAPPRANQLPPERARHEAELVGLYGLGGNG